MNQPWIYTCSPSRSPLLPPSPSHPSGSMVGLFTDKGSHPEQSQMLVLESCYKIFQPSHSKIEFSFYPIWKSSRTTRGVPKGKTGNDVNPPFRVPVRTIFYFFILKCKVVRPISITALLTAGPTMETPEKSRTGHTGSKWVPNGEMSAQPHRNGG